MKPLLHTFSAFSKVCTVTALSAVLSLASLPAHALGRLADVTLIDRDTGATLQVHYSNGQYWVAGRPGGRYAVNVRNRLGERILAVPSVDGVNVISGETAGWDQNGYVFSAHERYQISGWRKSSSEIAAFEFSSNDHSYAGRTGRPANVGVIGVALFREKQALPVPSPPFIRPYARESKNSMREESSVAAEAPAADRADGSGSGGGAENQAKAAPSAPRSAKLGTAHGQRETSVVTETTFTRRQNQPDETISIRYDSRDNLIAAGVIREPARSSVPRAFPQSDVLSYVPDPPAY